MPVISPLSKVFSFFGWKKPILLWTVPHNDLEDLMKYKLMNLTPKALIQQACGGPEKMHF